MNHRTLLLAASVASALVASGGCYHLTTKVPGVLDMRTDGSGAGSATRKAGAGQRSGFDSLMYGDGVTGGSELKVVDRKYWVCHFLPILNESATEEIQMAVGTEALRNCRIGQQYTVINWVIGVVGSWIPLVGFIMPPTDFHFWGTPVAASADVALPAADAPPPPDGAAPLAPEATPAPGN